MTLNSVTDKIRVVLSAAVTTNQLECVVLYNNSSAPAVAKGRVLIDTNSTTPVDLLTGQQGTTSLTITQITIYNKDTVAATVAVSYYNGSDDFILVKKTLQAGETLQYNQSEGFFLANTTKIIQDGADVSKNNGAWMTQTITNTFDQYILCYMPTSSNQDIRGYGILKQF